MLVLAAVTAVAAYVTAEFERNERADRQRSLAQRAGVVLERTTASPMRQVETISWALSGRERASGEAFDTLARRALPTQPLLSAIALTDRVSPGGGARYVTRRQVSHSEGARALAARAIPLTGDGPQAAALRAIERIGLSRATRILPAGTSALAVYSPVRDGEDEVAGAVLTVYDTRAIVTALRPTMPRGAPFSVTMNGRPLPGADTPPTGGVTHRVTMAGQPFEIVVGRGQEASGLILAVFGIGAILTLCLGLLTFQTQRREEWAMKLVDRRLAERDAAEERFSAAFAHAPIGMALVTLDGEIVQGNAAFVGMIGGQRNHLVDKPLADVLVPAERDWVADSLGMLEPGLQRVVHAERRCLHADGHIVWTAVSLTLTRDGAGRPEYLLAQFEDISDRRRYEAHLKHLADHDPLTGLYNRRAFERELDRHLERVRTDGAHGARDRGRRRPLQADQRPRGPPRGRRPHQGDRAQPAPARAPRATSSPGSAATSSPCSCARAAAPRPATSPTSCSTRSASSTS